MNILLISQCNKNALKETRRILDQFAERRGDRTWQTPITMQGLQTLHKMLRKTARRNTAVACHWIRGKDHSELMWIVGDAARFNAQGATPTNTTQRDVLRRQDENDWHTAEDIRLLAAMAGLLHDLGKANDAFQKKLKSKKPIADAYRHEWVSLRLFEAFVAENKDKQSDEEWLQRLANIQPGDISSLLIGRLQNAVLETSSTTPFKKMPPLAKTIGWLVVSHHRMPTPVLDDDVGRADNEIKLLPKAINANWCGRRDDVAAKTAALCWRFSNGLPFDSHHWCEHARKLAAAMLQRPGITKTNWLENCYVVHLSRMALMLADHHYSAEKSHARYGDAKFPLTANTLRKENNKPNQRLDEHLIGVEVSASRIVSTLPKLSQNLPRIARHKTLRQRSKISRFRWQDKAYDLAVSLQETSDVHGFFGVNMASTGCGKTLANARVMYGLSNPQQGARFSIALGLRSLTLQTGDVYREHLGLGDEDLAVLVGGAAIRALHKKQQDEKSVLNNSGTESQEDLMADNQFVHYEGSLEGPLNKWLSSNPNVQKLLNAPILTCTIDHLIPATEGTRGGRQIAPMLRLMSADLILDEPDDFGLEDLPALTRLVNWAGMLGSRVLISSATLPPALIEGLFHAYLAGRKIYQQNRGQPGLEPDVCCAWFDEYIPQGQQCHDAEMFKTAHRAFVSKRLDRLAKAEKRRHAQILSLPISPIQNREEVCQALAETIHSHIHQMHRQHANIDPKTHKKVSFGLIRMANIGPLVEVAKALYQLGADADCRIHLCVYHSKHPLLVRASIEQKLDRLLKRDKPEVLFEHEDMCQILERESEQHHIFVILATAVAEVGRDHDYDWAIVEPSSMRSIIQLAGRVRRHRPEAYDKTNILLLDTNVRHLSNPPDRAAFCRPGFESKHFMLKHHSLQALLTDEQLAAIDASARIQERDPFLPSENLVDLEHATLRDLMLEKEVNDFVEKPVYWWWQTKANYSGYLQRQQPFRKDTLGRQRYALLLNDDDDVKFYRTTPGEAPAPVDINLIHRIKLKAGERINFWGELDYRLALENLAQRLGIEESVCAERFGYVELEAEAGNGWFYHPSLGFSR